MHVKCHKIQLEHHSYVRIVLQIPIFRGADRPLVYRTEKRSSFYHGTDGFGDADFSKIEPRIEHEHAVHALVRLAHEYEGDYILLFM